MDVTGNAAVMSLLLGDVPALRMLCVLPDAGVLLQRVARAATPSATLRELVTGREDLLTAAVRAWDEWLAQRATTVAEQHRLVGDDGPTGALRLLVALALTAHDMRDGAELERLEWTLVLGSPDDAPEAVTLTPEQGCFVMQPGSISVGFVAARVAVAVAQWAIVLSLRTGLPHAADKLLGERSTVLDELRGRQNAAGRQALRLFGELGDEPASVLLVFVHGLYSTDAGLFDPVVERVAQRKGLGRVICVGFAHNPLLSIDDNAEQLASQLRIRCAGRPSNVAFITHHRGGLVARRAAVLLYERDPQAWGGRLIGCLSFGTPHRGVPYADSDARTLGAAMLVCRPDASGAHPPGFMRKSDLLRLVNAMGDARLGIADLCPPAAGAIAAGPLRWLDRLARQERLLQAEHGCRLRLHAVGGAAAAAPYQAWITGKLFAAAANDRLVEQASSAPAAFEPNTSRCTEAEHDSYFRDGDPALTEALGMLEGWYRERIGQEVADAMRLRGPLSLPERAVLNIRPRKPKP
jgi:hypothetical protein